MVEPKFLVGIDLGTSNCAVAFAELALGAEAPIQDFPIPQLQGAAEVAERPLLPSCIYLCGEHELPPEATRLPWDRDANSSAVVVGEFARWQGTRVPGHLITSAKSWLCHPGVDRAAAILPWGAPPEVNKLSPVEASARLLRHMAGAWEFTHPQAPIAAQEVILTVPASFDEAARALTVSAAQQAGLEKFTLVEEPQAAFYDFTASHRHDLAQVLEGIRLVLIVDVGGGTSDFTLVQVGATPEGPILRRIAVGEHLMLGGDNMDAALSRKAEERLLTGSRKLSATQWTQLVQAARLGKESLLSSEAPEQFNLSVAAEGSRLVGRALSTHLMRAEAEQTILDGFLPACAPDASPQRVARVALQELGLPYAPDPAITRHLAAFLRAHAAAGFAALSEDAKGPEGDRSDANNSESAGGAQPKPQSSILPRPDAILLNGGVFNSPKIAKRLLDVVSSWWPSAPPVPLLRHNSLELAVARGAAVYGLARKGLGRRIGGGAAHALYVGLEKAGSESPLALCVVSRGQEEGETIDLGQRTFHLALGRPVRFPLFSTAAERVEKSGEVVPVTDDLHPLPPIHTLLKGSGGKAGNVPVHLRAALTELGTLELWCVANETGERWRLEFELRGTESAGLLTAAEPVQSMPESFAEARAAVEHIFGRKGGQAQPSGKYSSLPKDVKQLWGALERILGPREQWQLPVLRELWTVLLGGAAKRRRSAEHERIYFQLLGYSLRPGFGYPLDEWRSEQTARLFGERVEFHKEKAGWNEFWILWRRISGGLTESRQAEIWSFLKPYLAVQVPPDPPKNLLRPKGLKPEGLDEMVRLGAALEHLEPAEKSELGDWIAARLRRRTPGGGPWSWALGRLGARAPIYGSSHKTVSAEKATEWVNLLLEPKLAETEGALFGLVQLARRTGDRARDLDDSMRARILARIRAAKVSPSWERMLTEVVALDAADKARALGDTLPAGLLLL
jgi:molecular chaperone DnaK (HSP70)